MPETLTRRCGIKILAFAVCAFMAVPAIAETLFDPAGSTYGTFKVVTDGSGKGVTCKTDVVVASTGTFTVINSTNGLIAHISATNLFVPRDGSLPWTGTQDAAGLGVTNLGRIDFSSAGAYLQIPVSGDLYFGDADNQEGPWWEMYGVSFATPSYAGAVVYYTGTNATSEYRWLDNQGGTTANLFGIGKSGPWLGTNLNCAGFAPTNLPTPTLSHAAATKGYVDTGLILTNGLGVAGSGYWAVTNDAGVFRWVNIIP